MIELRKVNRWDDKIQLIGGAQKVNLALMKSEIVKAQKEINRNFQGCFRSYLEQIRICEKWIVEARTLLHEKSEADVGWILLKQIKEDRDNLALLDKELLV